MSPRRVLAKITRFALRGREADYLQACYSQEGEDMILARHFEGKAGGFYIDVGAHHPQRFSNTYRFYLDGWRGINIDAMPGSMTLFNQIRPRDINLEIPISETSAEQTYYAFNEPALNGFSKQISEERHGVEHFHIVSETKLVTRPLADVLSEYIPPNQEVDFLTVDVEGLDYQVLASNNWERFRPELVLVEDLEQVSVEHCRNSKIAELMRRQDYQLEYKTVNTLFFRKR